MDGDEVGPSELPWDQEVSAELLRKFDNQSHPRKGRSSLTNDPRSLMKELSDIPDTQGVQSNTHMQRLKL